jgi:hypothetical protein
MRIRRIWLGASFLLVSVVGVVAFVALPSAGDAGPDPGPQTGPTCDCDDVSPVLRGDQGD